MNSSKEGDYLGSLIDEYGGIITACMIVLMLIVLFSKVLTAVTGG